MPKKKPKSRLAARLAKALEDAGISKAELARAGGVSESAIQKYLVNSQPRDSVIKKMATTLGVSYYWLRDGREPDSGQTQETVRFAEMLAELDANEREVFRRMLELIGASRGESYPVPTGNGMITSSLPTAICTREGQIVRCNDPWAVMVGKQTHGEIEGTDMIEWWPPSVARHLLEQIEHSMNNREVISGTAKWLGKTLYCNITPMQAPDRCLIFFDDLGRELGLTHS